MNFFYKGWGRLGVNFFFYKESKFNFLGGEGEGGLE